MGYIITDKAADALKLYEEHREVRFAAELDSGEGFVAFDGEVPGGTFDRVLTEEAFIWPWHAAPKRGIGTGREHYSLLPLDMASYLAEQSCVTGVAKVSGMLLVESDGPLAAGSGLWTAGVTAFRDRRLVMA